MIRTSCLVGAVLVLLVSFTILPSLLRTEYNATATLSNTQQPSEEATGPTEPTRDTRSAVAHVPLPDAVRAIYMSACVVGTPDFRERVVQFTRETEINSLVIDIKDFSGSIAFAPSSTDWQYAWEAASCGARDMRAFLEYLHNEGLYVIGRITVFQDPLLTARKPEWAVKKADRTTVWKDHKGLSFIEVGAREYWDHLIKLAVDSYNIGFDELNFDYVRYPSDGPMLDISFPLSEAGEYGSDKQANLEAFFAYLSAAMSDPDLFNAVRHENTGRDTAIPYTSADLFGMTTTNFDDLSIGQIQERAAPYFDFIAPMVYPSHYPHGSFGYGNPNNYPYEIVYHAMADGVARMKASTTPLQGFLHTPQTVINASGTAIATGMYTKPSYGPDRLRTWIQDFDYGGDYDAADVRAQIEASYDAGVMSYMVWAPSNIYTKAAYTPGQ